MIVGKPVLSSNKLERIGKQTHNGLLVSNNSINHSDFTTRNRGWGRGSRGSLSEKGYKSCQKY